MSVRHRESIVPVPVKTVEQQTICALHRVRAALMKTRTARLNTVRGLLREFGVPFKPQFDIQNTPTSVTA